MKKNGLIKAVAVLCTTLSIYSVGTIVSNAAVIDDSELTTVGNDTVQTAEYSVTTLPSKYSSKDLRYVTEVKYQRFNDCWAYASMATLESKLLRDGFDIDSMSVDHLNLWSTTRKNGTGWQRDSRDEGYGMIPLGYLTSWQGAVEDIEIGDVDLSGDLYGDDAPTDMTQYGVTEVEYLTKSNPQKIKQAIMDNGGVYSSYGSTISCQSSNMTSYFMPDTFNGEYTGHAIEIVGWDDNYGKINFNGSVGVKPKKPGAWLAKNSYGNYNSLGGYFWISYEDKYIFSEKYKPSYTFRKVEQISPNTRLEQNEIYGATYEFDYVSENKVTYMNQFDFSNGYNSLDRVMFETTAVGSNYSVYYVPSSINAKPNFDRNKWTKLSSGTVDYAGYICVDTKDFWLPLGYGTIAVEIDTTNASYAVENTFGVGEWITSSSNKEYKFFNDSKLGQSYISYNNKSYDLLDWYKEYNNDDLGGTFVIKAITNGNGAEVSLLGDVNLDGQVNITDATMIQKYLVESVELSKVRMLNADINGDKAITVSDVSELQKSLVKA